MHVVYIEDMKVSKDESIQRRATKFILCLPFLTNISYKERLMSVNLLPVCYWHELLDLVYFYKATHNMIHLDPSVVPFVRECTRRTRISVPSSQSFVPKKCKYWKIVLKNRDQTEKKNRRTRKQKTASPGVEPGLSVCTCQQLLDHCTTVTYMIWKINFVISKQFFSAIDAVWSWWNCIYHEFKYTFEEN